MALRCKTVRYCLGNLDQADPRVGKCWTDNGAGTWTNETTDINSSTSNDVPMHVTVNSAIYFGHARQFAGMTLDVQTNPSGGASVYEYWNGSAWSALTVTGTISDNNSLYWDPPSDWAATQVNSEVDGPWFYIRLRVATARTTAGLFNAVQLAVLLDLARNRTIHIPETTSRTIRHASMRVMIGFSAAIDFIAVRGRWGASAYADVIPKMTTTNQLALGETTAMIVDLDWDSATQAAWASGTSQTCDAWIAFHARGAAAVATMRASAWAELLITYEYDDASATQLNTLVLPIDSLTGGATTSLQTVGGTGGWPQLTGAGGIIKEASPVIRDVYAVIVLNTNEAGTTDYEIRVALDSEAEVSLFYGDAVNQSDYLLHLPWRRTDAATGSAHDLKVRTTVTNGATLEHTGAVLVVTYEYDDAASTTLTQTDSIPVQLQTGFGSGTTTADQSVVGFNHWIAADSPTLLRAGSVLYAYQGADPGNLLFSWGSQTARSYSVPAADTAGPVPFVQRFDAGAVAGTGGGTLGRGKNTFTATFRYDATPANGGGIGGMVYLTYSYTKTAGRHQSSAMFPAQRPGSLAPSLRNTGTLRMWIPEANWFIGSCGIEQFDNNGSGDTTGRLRVRRGSGLGWFTTPGALTGMDAQRGVRISSCAVEDATVRYSGDPNTDRLDPVSAAMNTTQDAASGFGSACAWVNWHDYTWSVAGTITGSGGGTVSLALHDAATTELLKTTSRVGDGAYSFTWHDNTREVYVVAREDGTHLGRSDNGLAV